MLTVKSHSKTLWPLVLVYGEQPAGLLMTLLLCLALSAALAIVTGAGYATLVGSVTNAWLSTCTFLAVTTNDHWACSITLPVQLLAHRLPCKKSFQKQVR